MTKATSVFNEIKRRMKRPRIQDYEHMIAGHLHFLKPVKDKKWATSRVVAGSVEVFQRQRHQHETNSLLSSSVGYSGAEDDLTGNLPLISQGYVQFMRPGTATGTTEEAEDLSRSISSASFLESDFDRIPDGSEEKEQHVTNHIIAARGYFAEMQAQGLKPTLKLYDILMNAHIHRGDNEKAIALFERVIEEGMVPDFRIYSSLVVALCNAGDCECATAVMSVMRSQQIKPDVILYTALMDGYGKSGDIVAMEAVFDEMVSLGLKPTPTTFGSLLNSYSRIGNIEGGEKVFERLQDAGYTANIIHHNSLIHGYGAIQDLDRCKWAFEQMCAVGILPSVTTYNILIASHISAGDIEGAMRWYEAMVSIDGLCSDVISAESQHHHHRYRLRHRIKRTYLEALSSPFGMRRREPNLATFNLLVWANAKRLDDIGASSAIQALLNRGFRPTLATFVPMLHCIARQHKLNEAWDMVKKLEEMARASLAASRDEILPSDDNVNSVGEATSEYESSKLQRINMNRSAQNGVIPFDAMVP